MNQELRERTILPVLIPVGAIIVTEIVVFSMSRVLLTAGEMGAVVVALGAALSILIGATAIAGSNRVKTNSIIGLLSVLLIATVGAGAYAMQRGAAYEHEAAENVPEVEVSAADLAFSVETLELGSGGTHIAFENADTQPHNVAVYPNEASLNDPLFKGEIIQAGQTTTYQVPAIRPGEYYFQCDVHPTMKGTAVVADEGPPAPPQGN